MLRALLLASFVLLAVVAPAAAAPPAGRGSDRVLERGHDAEGRLAWERGLRTDSDVIAFERLYHHADLKARPGGGAAGTASAFDGVNQIDFVSLGASSTIAVTTSWYDRSTGQAVESDGQYNTHYAWATDGSAGAMDALNIAAHEVGHTFGLDHPKGGGIACLTMHAYANLGETQKRTLGDGDLLGIRAIYGA